jgi:hypothetical protein
MGHPITWAAVFGEAVEGHGPSLARSNVVLYHSVIYGQTVWSLMFVPGRDLKRNVLAKAPITWCFV